MELGFQVLAVVVDDDVAEQPLNRNIFAVINVYVYLMNKNSSEIFYLYSTICCESDQRKGRILGVVEKRWGEEGDIING